MENEKTKSQRTLLIVVVLSLCVGWLALVERAALVQILLTEVLHPNSRPDALPLIAVPISAHLTFPAKLFCVASLSVFLPLWAAWCVEKRGYQFVSTAVKLLVVSAATSSITLLAYRQYLQIETIIQFSNGSTFVGPRSHFMGVWDIPLVYLCLSAPVAICGLYLLIGRNTRRARV